VGPTVTNTLAEWAARHGISQAALEDLRGVLFHIPNAAMDQVQYGSHGPEGDMVAQIRLHASKIGMKLFRNNVGAGTLENGSHIRWGLCNDSANLNKKVKSSDLIGIRPVRIEPRHVGHVLGLFTAREVKKAGWVYDDNDPQEKAQQAFLEWVLSMGGDARFTCVPTGDL
jgi:hypothetical protein